MIYCPKCAKYDAFCFTCFTDGKVCSKICKRLVRVTQPFRQCHIPVDHAELFIRLAW